FLHDFYDFFGFPKRANHRKHNINVFEPPFCAAFLNGLAFESESLDVPFAYVTTAASPAKHWVFLNYFVFVSALQAPVLVGFEVTKTDYNLPRLDCSSNRRY